VRKYALVSMWSEPDARLLGLSHGTLYVCSHMGAGDMRVIEIKSIISVVALIPMKPSDGVASERFFVVEKPGLEAFIIGQDDDLNPLDYEDES
jgi:hypothetical protein